jgi:hypothetical protein
MGITIHKFTIFNFYAYSPMSPPSLPIMAFPWYLQFKISCFQRFDFFGTGPLWSFCFQKKCVHVSMHSIHSPPPPKTLIPFVMYIHQQLHVILFSLLWNNAVYQKKKTFQPNLNPTDPPWQAATGCWLHWTGILNFNYLPTPRKALSSQRPAHVL